MSDNDGDGSFVPLFLATEYDRFRRIADNIGRSIVRRGAGPKTGLAYDVIEKT